MQPLGSYRENTKRKLHFNIKEKNLISSILPIVDIKSIIVTQNSLSDFKQKTLDTLTVNDDEKEAEEIFSKSLAGYLASNK